MAWLRTLLASGALLLVMVGSAHAADKQLLEKAREVALICAQHMPNSVAAKDAFKKEGFRYESSDGEYHYYTLNGRRLLAATTVTSSDTQGCLISVSRMTTKEAEGVIQTWLSLSNVQAVDLESRDITKSWVGHFKGGPVVMSIHKTTNFGFMRGALISAISLN